MPKSVFTGAHQHLVRVLREARQSAGLKQVELAALVGRDQTYISIIESGQRRVDVIEFLALSQALGADPLALLRKVMDSSAAE